MKGKTAEEVEAELKAGNFNQDAIKKIKPHKVRRVTVHTLITLLEGAAVKIGNPSISLAKHSLSQ